MAGLKRHQIIDARLDSWFETLAVGLLFTTHHLTSSSNQRGVNPGFIDISGSF